MVYLLHFDRPLHHARHYMGYTEHVEARLARHRTGAGARLLQVLVEKNIGFKLVRTWRGGRALERKLKNRHNAPKLCPVCNPNP